MELTASGLMRACEKNEHAPLALGRAADGILARAAGGKRGIEGQLWIGEAW